MSITARRRDGESGQEGTRPAGALVDLAAGRGPAMHDARVIGRDASGALQVQMGSRVLGATRAASCLVEPGGGDRVLVAVLGREAFVLAVLARDHDAAPGTTIVTDGDLALVARGGRVSMQGSDGIDLSGPAITANAPRITLATDALDLATRTLSLVGELAQARLGAAKLVARSADAVLDRLFVRAERAFRQVDGLDQTRAGQIDMVAKDCALLRGEHTIVGADGMLKVDGEQVHIG